MKYFILAYRLSWLQDIICPLPSRPHPSPPHPSPPLPPHPSPPLPSPPLPYPTLPYPTLPLQTELALRAIVSSAGRPGAYVRALLVVRLFVCPDGESGDAPSQWQQNATISFIKIL